MSEDDEYHLVLLEDVPLLPFQRALWFMSWVAVLEGAFIIWLLLR